MGRRALVLLAAIAAVGAGGVAVASKAPRLFVLPHSPTLGQQSTIEVRGHAKSPVYASISGPGLSSVYRLRLQRAGVDRWRGAYVFGSEGNWLIAARGASRLVYVRLPPAASFAPPGEPGCAPASPANPASREVRGSGGLWATGGIAASSTAALDGALGRQTKIVWRLGGSGDIDLVAVAPDGSQLAPDWLKAHTGSSSWTRPGDEWGTGLTFTQPGCWDIHAARQGASGDVWIVVRS